MKIVKVVMVVKEGTDIAHLGQAFLHGTSWSFMVKTLYCFDHARTQGSGWLPGQYPAA